MNDSLTLPVLPESDAPEEQLREARLSNLAGIDQALYLKIVNLLALRRSFESFKTEYELRIAAFAEPVGFPLFWRNLE